MASVNSCFVSSDIHVPRLFRFSGDGPGGFSIRRRDISVSLSEARTGVFPPSRFYSPPRKAAGPPGLHGRLAGGVSLGGSPLPMGAAPVPPVMSLFFTERRVQAFWRPPGGLLLACGGSQGPPGLHGGLAGWAFLPGALLCRWRLASPSWYAPWFSPQRRTGVCSLLVVWGHSTGLRGRHPPRLPPRGDFSRRFPLPAVFLRPLI